MLLRGVGTLRYSSPPNACVQWQLDGLKIHQKMVPRSRLPRSTSHFTLKEKQSTLAPSARRAGADKKRGPKMRHYLLAALAVSLAAAQARPPRHRSVQLSKAPQGSERGAMRQMLFLLISSSRLYKTYELVVIL